MTTAIATEQIGVDRFKLQMDEVLSQHDYFRQHILPRMREGIEFYVVNGKRSLSKAGSEFLCSLYSLNISFTSDEPTRQSFKSADDLVALVATLKNAEDKIVGQGRGCAQLSKNDGDYNKTVKMCQKSAAIDGTLRSLGLSGYFSQDLENLPPESIQAPKDYFPQPPTRNENSEDEAAIPSEYSGNGELATLRQRRYLTDLALQNLDDGEEKEKFLANIDSLSKSDCSDSIKAMLASVGR